MTRADRRRAEREGRPVSALPKRKAPRGGVQYAVIHGDYTDNAFNWALRALELYDRNNDGFILGYSHMYSGPLLSAARNEMVETFLDSDAEWMFMMDDDMIFRPDALARMMALADPVERPIVSGLYFGGGKSAVITPHVFVVEHDIEGNPYTVKRLGFPWDEPFDCDAVGAGFMVVHRSVFEKMGEVMKPVSAYPYFQETQARIVEDDGTTRWLGLGEDVTFCIRARKLGYSIWVEPRIYLGHSKRYTIDRNVYQAQQVALETLDETELGREHLRKLGQAV